MTDITRPLDGILVVALEQAVAAPFTTSRLADAGARVIKIERPDGGDSCRNYNDYVHGESAYFVWLNRGKESIALDIKNDTDRKILETMIARADVFIQNLAPGATEKLGLGSDALRDLHTKLVTCDITGYGNDGPMKNAKAYDLLVQCESGLASITGTADAPGRVGVSVCDIATGMTAHAAILEALIERSKTGRGRGVSVSMFDTMADWMSVPLMQYEYAGKETPRVGLSHTIICPYGAFTCSDGSLIVIAVQNQNEWQHFCEGVLGDGALANDPRFKTNSDRLGNQVTLEGMIRDVFAAHSREEMFKLLNAANIASGSVTEVRDLANHPQLDRVEFSSPSGPVSCPAGPIRRSNEAPEYGPAPALGAHSESLRKEFG